MWLAAVELAVEINALVVEGAEAKIEGCLSRAARAEQAREEIEQRARKAYAAGYSPHDEQFYSVGLLRRLLPAYLDGGVSEAPPKRRDNQPRVSGGEQSYGDWLCMMLDVDQAMGELRPYHRRILEAYFAYPQGSSGWTHEEIASAVGIGPEVLRKRVWRALRALQGLLGGASPYVK